MTISTTTSDSTANRPASDLTHAARARRADVRSAGDGLFRILDARGRIAGHVQLVIAAHGVRFRARRYSPARHAFADLGDFWKADDALSCLPL